MTGRLIVGVDVARRSDYAVAVHLAPRPSAPGWRVTRADQIPHAADYEDLARYCAAMARSGAVVIVDGTGVGVPLIEDARKRADGATVWSASIHGGRSARRTGAASLSLAKTALIGRTRQLIDVGRLVIPQQAPGASLLLEQLAAIAPVPRRGRRPALEATVGHDDVAFALMLAAWMTEETR